MSADAMILEGVVLSAERVDLYRVRVRLGDQTHEALVRRAGRMIVHRIRIVPGDVVVVELSAHDPRRGRITYRGPLREAG